MAPIGMHTIMIDGVHCLEDVFEIPEGYVTGSRGPSIPIIDFSYLVRIAVVANTPVVLALTIGMRMF